MTTSDDDKKKGLSRRTMFGAAAVVAAVEAIAALGSDTGGSVRLPAAYCGCVGL